MTGPPSLPKHFKVKKGCLGDIMVGSDTEDDDEDEMNIGRVEDEQSSDEVGEHGDS